MPVIPLQKTDLSDYSAKVIRQQARQWVIGLGSEDLSDAEKIDLSEWISRSALHRQIFYETARIWISMDKLTLIISKLD